MLKTKEEIKAWLTKMSVTHYTITDDLTVDVDGVVDIYGKKLKEIPIQFGKVSGAFDCSDNELISLKGTPKIIQGSFNCSCNNLTSLEYLSTDPATNILSFNASFNKIKTISNFPEIFNADIDLRNNQLRTLKGISKIIKGELLLKSNLLESLEYFPSFVSETINLSENKLKDLCGLPSIINKSLYLNNNSIESFNGAPDIINGNLSMIKNNISSLKGCPSTVNGFFSLLKNPIVEIKDIQFINSIRDGLHFSHPDKITIQNFESFYNKNNELFLFLEQIKSVLLKEKLNNNLCDISFKKTKNIKI